MQRLLRRVFMFVDFLPSLVLVRLVTAGGALRINCLSRGGAIGVTGVESPGDLTRVSRSR